MYIYTTKRNSYTMYSTVYSTVHTSQKELQTVVYCNNYVQFPHLGPSREGMC